jgi:hypothetical protein
MFCREETLPDNLVNLLKQETLNSPREHILSPIEFSPKTRSLINKEFLKKGWSLFEYALAFTWLAGTSQPIHMDGNPPQTVRNCSVNVLVAGGQDAYFQWYDAPQAPAFETVNGIRSWGYSEAEAKLIYEEPLRNVSIVRTCVPHRVKFSEDTILLCLRLVGNPQLL